MAKLVLVSLLTIAGLLSACVVVPYDEGRGGHGAQRHDRDRDGVPDRADRDRDGDGIPNRADRRPDNPRRY